MTNDDAIKIIENYEVLGCGYCHQGGEEIEQAFRMAIEALKAKKSGEWIDVNGDGSIMKCSRCGEEVCCTNNNFCSNCGAKMKGGEQK